MPMSARHIAIRTLSPVRKESYEAACLRVEEVEEDSALLHVLPHAGVPSPKLGADEHKAYYVSRKL